MKRILLFKNAERASYWVAEYFDKYIQNNPKSVIGFVTGTTPLLTYKLLQDYCKKGTSWKKVTSFNLSEIIGIPYDYPETFRLQMYENLFKGLDIKRENMFYPDVFAKDLKKEADRYENFIQEKGNIDLQYLTLGTNGSIAKNEPGTPFDLLSHITKLSTHTRTTFVEQGKFPTIEETPKIAITVGIQTIMEFKEIVMVAVGPLKTSPVKKMLEGPITPVFPASSLQNHENVIFVLDVISASKLDLSKYNFIDMHNY